MARRIVSLILGLTVLGLVTSLLLFTKEAEVEQATLKYCTGDCPPADLAAHILITVDGNGAVQLDGRPVESAQLTDEIALIVARAANDGLPVPPFALSTDPAVGNDVIVDIMLAVQQGGGTEVTFGPSL